MDILPTSIIGLALLGLAIYLIVTRNLSVLIGIQAKLLKKDEEIVAKKAAYFIIGMALLTFILPIMEALSIVFVIVDIALICVLLLALLYYLQKQKI